MHLSFYKELFLFFILFSIFIFLFLFLVIYDAILQVQESRVQDHWVVPRSTQNFILPRSKKWVVGFSGNLVLKSKLTLRSGSNLWGSWTPYIKKGDTVFLRFWYCSWFFSDWCTKIWYFFNSLLPS